MLDFNTPLRKRLRDRIQSRVRRLEAPPRDHLRRRRCVAEPARFDQGLPMLVYKVQVLRFPEGVHGRVEFAPPPQVHGGGPMLVAGDLDAGRDDWPDSVGFPHSDARKQVSTG